MLLGDHVASQHHSTRCRWWQFVVRALWRQIQGASFVGDSDPVYLHQPLVFSMGVAVHMEFDAALTQEITTTHVFAVFIFWAG